MEKEANISSSDGFSFSVSEKKSTSSSSNTTSDAVISFMKLQNSTKSILSENNLDRRFGGGMGPADCTTGGATDVLGNIYLNNNGGENFGTKKSNSSSTNLQPFHNFTCSYPSTTTQFKSPEGGSGMATSGGVGFPPFTSAQWKELERQAMIYKFFISSVPVPPHLLFPADTLCNGKYSKNGDLEPGRCKRTDGKKWRCSRDVAPNQKYCERHLHRGRPRSRKPVEVKKTVVENHKKIRQQLELQNPVLPHCSATTDEPLLSFSHKTDLSISTSTSSYKGNNRDLGCEMVDQQWNHLVESNMGSSIYGSSASIFHNMEQQQPLNLFSYSPFSPQEYEAPTGFIDAWSLDNLKYNNSSNNGISESSISLNLSMAMGDENVLESDVKDGCNTNDKTKDLRCPVSWGPLAGGGPLAEALHSGSVPASPYDSISSNQATAVSSPSGVLHRTLFSHSDNSVCNSPTALASEVAFHWLN